MCIDNGDTLEPDNDILLDNFDPEPPHELMEQNETSGNDVRDRLAAQL